LYAPSFGAPETARSGCFSKNCDEPKQQELLYSEIERLTKAFRGHRCALDFDWGFVHSELKQATTLKDDEGE
jgi:hypothetical protein